MRLTKTASTVFNDATGLVALKRQLRIEGDYADDEIKKFARRSIEDIESRCDLQLLEATYEGRFDQFPRASCFDIKLPPLQSVTSITYTDADGTPGQTWATSNYETLTDIEPGQVRLTDTGEYPQGATAIIVTFVNGYGDRWSDLPELVQDAIASLVHHRFYHRDGRPIPQGVMDLITQLMVGDDFHEYV